MKSPSTRTGSFPAGFTARNSGRRCSPLGGVYVDELEFDIQLAQRPEDADRTGRREPIELHGVAVSFGPERRPRSGAWPAVGSRGGSSRVWLRAPESSPCHHRNTAMPANAEAERSLESSRHSS